MKALWSNFLDFVFPNRLIIRALVSRGISLAEHEQDHRKFKYMVKNGYVLFENFNPKLNAHDFYGYSQFLNELFNKEFVEYERESLTSIRAYFAEWNKKYKLLPALTCLGYNGKEPIYIADEISSFYIFGKSNSGKTTWIKSLIRGYLKFCPIANLIIVSGKPSDFKDFKRKIYSYSDEDQMSLKEEIKQIENQRAEAEKTQTFLRKRNLIVLDEFHLLSDKEIISLLYNLIRIGRSQKILIILASQSGASSQFKDININQIGVKICVGRPESQGLAETLFPKDLAYKFYHARIPKGFAYIIADHIAPQKIKLHYDQ